MVVVSHGARGLAIVALLSAAGCGEPFTGTQDGGNADPCRALSFDGESLVRVPSAAEFDAFTELTVEAYVRPDDILDERHIVSHHHYDPHYGYVLMVMPYGAEPTFEFRFYANGQWLDVNSPISEPRRWYHVAATYDGDRLVLFVDGHPLAEDTIGSQHADAPDQPVHIGAASYADGFHFLGAIDEVRISRVARYFSAFAPSPTPFVPDADTVALWHLDEADGQTVADATSLHPGSLGGDSQPGADDPDRTAVECLADIAASLGP
jgi:hypothetical protein